MSSGGEDACEHGDRRAGTLARHGVERRELRKRAEKMRSFVPKKDRAGRQRVDEEIAELEEKLRRAHVEQLEAIGAGVDAAGPTPEPHESTTTPSPEAEAAAFPATTSFYRQQQLSRQQKRRQSRAASELVAERRRAEARRQAGPSERERELAAIQRKLEAVGMRIVEMPADGDCMYSAVAHQLARRSEAAHSAASVREVAASHMLQRRAEYADFVGAEEGSLDDYCGRVRSTKQWGGQLELRAIAQAFQVRIVVYSDELPTQTMGDGESRTLHLSFHRAYYALGEHYNSVVPVADGAPSRVGAAAGAKGVQDATM